jgi:hypothetical protein
MLALAILPGLHRSALPAFLAVLAVVVLLAVAAPILSRIRASEAAKADCRPDRKSAQREARLELESRHKEL